MKQCSYQLHLSDLTTISCLGSLTLRPEPHCGELERCYRVCRGAERNQSPHSWWNCAVVLVVVWLGRTRLDQPVQLLLLWAEQLSSSPLTPDERKLGRKTGPKTSLGRYLYGERRGTLWTDDWDLLYELFYLLICQYWYCVVPSDDWREVSSSQHRSQMDRKTIRRILNSSSHFFNPKSRWGFNWSRGCLLLGKVIFTSYKYLMTWPTWISHNPLILIWWSVQYIQCQSYNLKIKISINIHPHPHLHVFIFWCYFDIRQQWDSTHFQLNVYRIRTWNTEMEHAIRN